MKIVDGWRLRGGVLVNPDNGEPLKGEKLDQRLASYELFSVLKTGRHALRDERDKVFAEHILAGWREKGYE